jgi:lipoprotein-anchoring transpeptidase ErfK/SrfK
MRKLLIAVMALLSVCTLATTAAAGTIVAKVNISTQTMTVTENGWPKYRWKVSTARPGYRTPTGAWHAYLASLHHRSRKYDNAPMPYAIFFNGGYAIHATYELKRLGRPASHGCIRLHPENAAIFYGLATKYGLGNTKVIVQQ